MPSLSVGFCGVEIKQSHDSIMTIRLTAEVNGL